MYLNLWDAPSSKKNSAIIAGLIMLVLFAATILLIPNGINLRLQHTPNFTFFMTVAAGIYILIAIDGLLGALVLWACFQLFTGGPRTVEYILFGLCVFFIALVEKQPRWHQYEDYIYDFIMLLATICVGFQVMQACGAYYYIAPDLNSYFGLMGNQDDMSCLLAVGAAPFLRSGKIKWIWIPILGLILAHSYMGVVAFGVVLCMVVMRLRNWKVKMALFAALLIFIVGFHCLIKPFALDQHKAGRLEIWKTTLTVAMTKPWTGWGFAQYDRVIPIITSSKYLSSADREMLWTTIRDKKALLIAAGKVSGGDLEYFRSDKQQERPYIEAHNDYVEWFFVAGIIGAVLLLLVVARSLFLAHLRAHSKWLCLQTARVPFYGLLASCICALFFFSWQTMPTQALTVLYLGTVSRVKSKGEL
jgi:O-antigen ligase